MTVEEMILLKTGDFELTPMALAVEETGKFIFCSYCSLEEVPAAFDGLRADMALDYALKREDG